MTYRYRNGLLIGAMMACAAIKTHAEADRFIAVNARWRAECGACHVAYPPQLLTARDWTTIMGRLDRHYGSDASLEPDVVTEIQKFLQRHAGRKSGGGSNDLPRITSSSWFVREHDEVPARLWKSNAVKSPANCVACHRRADKGDFNEDSVQLPE